jgi:hypothetical protein
MTNIYSYKSINHFKETLRLFSGQTQHNIPDEIYKMVKDDARNNRISINDLTRRDILTTLKRHAQPKYYEHAFSILKTLKHDNSIIFTPIMEAELSLLFEQICSIRNKLTINNNLNYNSILYQLCKLKNITAATDLLSSNNIHNSQRQWKEICQILSDKQEIELKNHINTKVTPLLSIILNLPYNHIIENISHYIYTLTKNDMFWIRAFNNLE